MVPVLLEFFRPQQRRKKISKKQNGEYNYNRSGDIHIALPQLFTALDIPER